MALSVDDILTRAGHQMWRELPEENRYRDTTPAPDEPGDLAAYLHGLGHLLDLIRGTTEQLYADSFAEVADARSGGRQIQSWLLPYLGDLIGADLVAPDPLQRVAELNASVRWYKSKGTVTSVDEVSDVITGVEAVAREGWRRMLTCPRMGLPPFTLPPEATALGTTANGQPRVAYADDPIGRAAMPLGCPDFRTIDRAVADPTGSNPLYRITQPAFDKATGVKIAPTRTYWRPLAPEGVPCFPGAYDDHAPRMPDLRDQNADGIPGPHPRRTIIHARPPDGLFDQGLAVLSLTPDQLTPSAASPILRITPRDAFALANVALGDTAPDRVVVNLTADIVVAKDRKLDLEGILITGRVAQPGGGTRAVRIRVAEGARLVMSHAACERVLLKGPGPDIAGEVFPSLDATDCILGDITGGSGHARLVYTTVMGETDVVILQASDCILGTLTDHLNCAPDAGGGPSTCLRYSRATPPTVASVNLTCLALGGGNNTVIPARFAARSYCAPAAQPGFRAARYGEPGYGVLAMLCPDAIRQGAEDEGEMGAHHHQFHAAELTALARKLTRFLPLGQEIAIFHDPHLAQMPPALAE